MDYVKLGLGKATSVITNIEIANWGHTITISCLYDPAESKPYQIVLDGCREFRWEVICAEEIEETHADIIGVSFDNSSHEKSVIITADVFEVTINYREYTILKSW